MLDQIAAAFLLDALAKMRPIFANEVFVILGRRRPLWPRIRQRHLQPLLNYARVGRALPDTPAAQHSTAIVVTTYNRPWALARSLPQIAALGAPMLVVDDGSDAGPRQENAKLAAQCGAQLLALPSNRGLAAAINAGIAFWLADPACQWITLFSDDVDVRPDTLKVLWEVQDAASQAQRAGPRPVLAGRYAPEHPLFGKGQVAGHEVCYQRSSPGFPMHAHRSYWQDVLPVPTLYLGAPKPGHNGQGSGTDWWITAWSPKSVTKKGLFVICIPGLVRHFANATDQSTWDNSCPQDPAL
jgi:hypothetical protein